MEYDLTEVIGIEIEELPEFTDVEIMANYLPEMWIDADKRQIDENTFARAFCDVNNLQYNNGLFYSKTGKETEEIIAKHIWESIADVGINRDVAKTTQKLLAAVKLCATVPALKTDPDIVPFSGGELHVSKWLYKSNEYTPVPYRLPSSIRYDLQKTPYFDRWLKDLFYPEDLPVIQEYLGYCLVPTTKAQKALFLVGEGGAGKSGLGVILESILGDAMLSIANTQEFLQDKFKLPELENKLVLYDDDLDSAALTETGLYKKLITNTLNITADRKYGQPFKFTPHIKLVACCNKMLSSMYDNTSGFFRRLLPVVVKPIAPDFVPDLQFYDHLRTEADGIVQWALVGLRRLIGNNWVLSESQRTRDYLTQKRSIDDPLPEFFGACFEIDPNGEGVTSVAFLRVYESWCRANNVTPQKPRVVQLWVADNGEKYGVKLSQNIVSGDRRVRGYKGVKIRSEWAQSDGKIDLFS